MKQIKISEEDNLVIQPLLIGKLLLDLKAKNFLNSEYFALNFNDELSNTLKVMTLDSQGIVITLFYIFLVVPYEKLKEQLSTQYNEINIFIKKSIDNNVFLIKSNYKNNKNDFLRHIRNSVAHVNFKFIGGKTLTFIDKNFELTIPINNIYELISLLYGVLSNYFNQNKEVIEKD